MSFYICLPNFVEIERSAAELWRHIEFSRWRSYSQKSTPGFRFSDGICLRKWKSICMPNFDEISQIHDKTTCGFGKKTSAILKFCSLFRFRWMYCHRYVNLHLPAKFPRNWTIGGKLTSDVISNFQDGGHRVRNLLPASGLVTESV